MNSVSLCPLVFLLVSALPAQNISPENITSLPNQIGVRVYNIAGAPGAVLQVAQRKSAEILRAAGIESNWYTCPVTPTEQETTSACMNAAGPANLVLKLIPNEVAEQFYESNQSLGFALLSDRGLPTSDAWVFYGRVVAQARDGGHFLPTVLGHAMAHEIGHLLLGQGSHTNSGIMKGFWGQNELRQAATGGLRFTPKQTRRMHAQLSVRRASR